MKVSVNFYYRFAFLIAGFASVCVLALPAYAADIPGVYPPLGGPEEREPEKEEVVTPLKRVFSSQLKHEAEAVKLDRLYHSVESYLWEISQTNQIHQKKLTDLLQPQKFQYTRRSSEFKTPMMMAMDDLNKNRKDFKALLSKTGEDFKILEPAFKEEEATVAALWDQKIADLDTLAENYFKSQHKYLNLYNKLVSYIMQHAGGYYYSSENRKVMFYEVEEYTYFGETVDALNKISFGQKKMLKDARPLEFLP